MAISNIFRTGSGGGTVPGAGFEFPAETIVLSGEDLTAQGYQPLDEDLILSKSQAPVLYDIYKSINSFTLVMEENNLSNDVYECIEGLYFYADNLNKRLVFSEDFTMLTGVETFDYTHTSDSNLTFLMVNNGILYFTGTSLEIIAFKLDLTQELTSDKISNINVVENIFTLGFVGSAYGLTNNYFVNYNAAGQYRVYNLDNETGTIDTDELNTFLVNLPYSDPVTEQGLLFNDFILSRGTITKISDNTTITIQNYDHISRYVIFNKDGFDYVSFQVTSSSHKTFKVDENGVFSQEYEAIGATNLTMPFYKIKNNTYSACLGTNGNLGTSNTVLNSTVIVGDGTYLGVSDIIDYTLSSPKTFFNSNMTDKNVYLNQVSSNAFIIRDETIQKSGLVKVVDDNSETFVIEAIPSGTTDKKYWIFIE